MRGKHPNIWSHRDPVQPEGTVPKMKREDTK